MNRARFDFGCKPAEEGYIKVTGSCLYDGSGDYGIAAEAEAVEKDKGEKNLCRDYLLFDGNTFTVKLDNGSYNVRVYTGDYIDEGDVVTKFTVNGKAYHMWVNDGRVPERELKAEVTDGIMSFGFSGRHACLNAIDIAPDCVPEMSEVSCEKDIGAKKQKIALSWDKSSEFAGYRVVRRAMYNGYVDKVIDTAENSFTDTDLELCADYEYKVFGLDSFGFKSERGSTVKVNVSDGKPNNAAVTGLKAVSEPKKVILTWDKTPGAVWYNVYQKAPYGIYKKIASASANNYTDYHVVTNVEFIYAVEAVTTSGITKRAEIKNEIKAEPFRRKMETLNRGLVAMKTVNGVFLSWRINAYEYEKGMNFVLFRNGEKITDVITDSTNYLDKDGKAGDTYTVKAVIGSKTEKDGYTAKVIDADYLSVPLDKPAPYTTPDGNTYEYHANDAAVADLDGDGEYEFVIKWVANGKDNSHKGYTGVVYMDAYKMDGTRLWRIDLGVNIRSGAHYTQFMVYDFNCDGKAEMVCKTADGTIDGMGNVIGDINADYRNKDGFILDGPEFLTVFDGVTGAAIDTVDYDPPRGNVRDWGDSWGNRVDRFLACVAYLDGVHPSVVMCRGYYDTGCPTVLVAYDMVDNRLVKRWKFLADKNHNIEYTNQGNHNLGVGDIDGDGYDEIVYGACAIDHDGTGIYSTGLEHGDAMHLGSFTPATPNLDFFQIHEHEKAEYGYEVRDPATGVIKWGIFTGRDTTRGLCAKIDPRYEGNQVWVLDEELYTFDGKLITKNAPKSINFAIWWDGDLIRELLDHDWNGQRGIGQIYKWDYENDKLDVILDTKDAYSNNWTKGNPCIQASIIGDWREEAVWRNEDSTELRIYTTTELTNHKFYTFMHDSVYRLGIAWQNTAYNQPPHTGFYIGDDMKEIPVPKHDYVRGEIMPEFTEDI